MNIDFPEQALCDLCQGIHESHENRLIFCSHCALAVHQKCYLRELEFKVPSDDWYCDRCLHLIHHNLPGDAISCVLCPDQRGLMTTWDDGWVHLVCVNWISEIWLADDLKTVENRVIKD